MFFRFVVELSGELVRFIGDLVGKLVRFVESLFALIGFGRRKTIGSSSDLDPKSLWERID